MWKRISGMYTNYVCSKDHLKNMDCVKSRAKHMTVMLVTMALRNFSFTTLTVSTNALVSLYDDTAEQRQLLSESKRCGEFIYFDASKIHVDGFLYHSWECRIYREDFSLRSCRQILPRHVQIFKSSEQYSFKIHRDIMSIEMADILWRNFCQNTIFLLQFWLNI